MSLPTILRGSNLIKKTLGERRSHCQTLNTALRHLDWRPRTPEVVSKFLACCRRSENVCNILSSLRPPGSYPRNSAGSKFSVDLSSKDLLGFLPSFLTAVLGTIKGRKPFCLPKNSWKWWECEAEQWHPSPHRRLPPSPAGYRSKVPRRLRLSLGQPSCVRHDGGRGGLVSSLQGPPSWKSCLYSPSNPSDSSSLASLTPPNSSPTDPPVPSQSLLSHVFSGVITSLWRPLGHGREQLSALAAFSQFPRKLKAEKADHHPSWKGGTSRSPSARCLEEPYLRPHPHILVLGESLETWVGGCPGLRGSEPAAATLGLRSQFCSAEPSITVQLGTFLCLLIWRRVKEEEIMIKKKKSPSIFQYGWNSARGNPSGQ